MQGLIGFIKIKSLSVYVWKPRCSILKLIEGIGMVMSWLLFFWSTRKETFSTVGTGRNFALCICSNWVSPSLNKNMIKVKWKYGARLETPGNESWSIVTTSAKNVRAESVSEAINHLWSMRSFSPPGTSSVFSSICPGMHHVATSSFSFKAKDGCTSGLIWESRS